MIPMTVDTATTMVLIIIRLSGRAAVGTKSVDSVPLFAEELVAG